MQSVDRDRWCEIDSEIVSIGKHIKVLSALEWPPEARDEFLGSVRAGQPKLPEPPRPRFDHTVQREALARIAVRLPGDHPVEVYLRETAKSYEISARMLESCGQPAFTELGRRLYGGPDQRVAKSDRTVVDAADQFLKATAELSTVCAHQDDDFCVIPETVVDALKGRASTVFTDNAVAVELDAGLSSKAAAGAQRVRVRSSTCFTREDVSQLVEHELMVHTLTAINGRAQPRLTTMGVGAPRTTMTQEGLAVFAELITGSMDLNRLRRIALRPKGLQLALGGADFIEVFRFFRDEGQDEEESYLSTYRLFRGGDVRGGVAFPKDGVYLLGVLAVHSFLRKALETRNLHHLTDLFAGRMALRDVVSLEPFFRSGFIQLPRYEPEWVTQRSRLASFLTYSDFVHGLDLSALGLEELSHIVEDPHPASPREGS